MIQSLLNKDPKKRPSTKQILEMPVTQLVCKRYKLKNPYRPQKRESESQFRQELKNASNKKEGIISHYQQLF